MTPPEPDPQRISEELHTARGALLELAREVSELRIYRATARPGWTLRHELAALAAADAELLHVVEELRRRPSPLALDLRRRYGETMHSMQELQLGALLDRLEEGGARVAATVREHPGLLARPLRVAGREVASLADYLHAHVERARGAVDAFREGRTA